MLISLLSKATTRWGIKDCYDWAGIRPAIISRDLLNDAYNSLPSSVNCFTKFTISLGVEVVRSKESSLIALFLFIRSLNLFRLPLLSEILLINFYALLFLVPLILFSKFYKASSVTFSLLNVAVLYYI